jgi:hypothetical protein
MKMQIPFIGEFFRRRNSLEHAAKRRIRPETIENVAEALSQAGFSPQRYRSANDDLIRALPDDTSALLHFITYCGDETRLFPVDLSLPGLRRLCELRVPRQFVAKVFASLVANRCVPWSPLWTAPDLAQRQFWADLLAIMRGVGTPYFVVGDSHSNLYSRVICKSGRILIPIHILCSGCSGMGLSNPHSKSGAGNRLVRLAAALNDSNADVPLFFKFGQVDIEFVFNFDRISNDRTEFSEDEFLQYCRRTLASYLKFGSTHFANRLVIVVGVFPPTLSDACWREGYVNAHIVQMESSHKLDMVVRGIQKLQIPSLLERTRQHAQYNRLLSEAADREKMVFLHDFPHFLGPDGITDPVFIPTGMGTDHHLEYRPTTPIIDDLIAKQVLALRPV